MKSEKYLTKPEEFALVYEKGRSWADSLLAVKALPNGLAFSRYGFSISRHVGKATVRNRIKRKLREIIRQKTLEPGWDIVVIVRPAAGTADYAAFNKSVEGILRRARILVRNYEGACFSAN